MTKDEERRLVSEARRGSGHAFEALVSANQRTVYNLALKLLGTPDDALDASQEAFLKAYTNLSSFRGECRFSVWLYRLAYNSCMDFMRRNRRSGVVSLTPEEDEPEMDFPDPRPLPEEEVERRELRAAVRRAVRLLPDDKREILVMREFSGMSYAAISEALGVDEGTVKSRISRARAALASLLAKSGTFSDIIPSKVQKGGGWND